MTETDQADSPKSLADILIEQNLLSVAQVELAIADQEINDIPLEEILLVRGWITQDKLYSIAPWLKPGSTAPAPPRKTESVQKPTLNRSTQSIQKPSLNKPTASVQKPSLTKPEDTPSSTAATSAANKTFTSSTSSSALDEKAAPSSGGAASKPAPKPDDIPREPPQRPAGTPVVISSPVKSDHEENLHAYKELLKKIIAIEPDAK